jgi:ribonucleoside-diphosphate reductase alpha chain
MMYQKNQTTTQKPAVLPTPPLPADLPPVELTANARQVLERRYVRRTPDGKPAESVEEMFWRVAYHVAACEETWNQDALGRARQFYRLLTSKSFFPNSPTFTGAGTPLGQLAACFVLPISDDMGRDAAGIFQTLRDAALIQQTGGGNGFSFSRLRPKGALVKSSAGQATGPVGFLRVYDKAFGEIAQGGSRRGANMGVLRVDHPDIEEFITCKTDENAITNFNISVGITDDFMRAVENDEDWELRFPDVKSEQYKGFSGTLEEAEARGVPVRVYKTVRARELFDKIVTQAHHNGEPGVLFLDAANRSNPVPHLYALEATNPCFVGSTRLLTNRGLLTIQELAESEAELMVATDLRAPDGGRGKAKETIGIVYRVSSPAWKTRTNVPIYKVTTQHGYSVTATADHKFLTLQQGYVELENLKAGDVLLLQSGQGVWSDQYRLPNLELVEQKMEVMGQGGDRLTGHLVPRKDFVKQYSNLPSEWSHELGVVLGTLVGDGWLSPASGSPVGMVFNQGADELLGVVQSALAQWFGSGHLHARGAVRQLTYGRLPYEFFASLGVLACRAHEKRVPESLWRAPRGAVVGFLQGLFTTDGTVNLSERKKSCSIRLASASLVLLQEVQLLLLNFGIISRILKRRAAGNRYLPDGKGGRKEYFVHADYELLIDKSNRDRFVRTIGFLETSKQKKAEQFIAAKARCSNRETFQSSVLAIEPVGNADVYDLTESQTHSVIANGIVAHQCGEQWLGPYENCCLGSVNLAQHMGPQGTVDWEKLRQNVALATIFLDDVVEANAYVPAVPQLKEAAHRARRIGLGIMGLGDLMYHAGIRYGSEEGQEFGAQVMEFVRYHAMRTSVELAQQRGPFLAIEGSLYDPQDLKWRPPEPVAAYQRDFGRPSLDWEAIRNSIRQHGIRNAAQTTVAPTGTIATVAGCEGYGCEPVFALAYIRHVNDNGKDLQLTYTSPLFDQALMDAGLDGAARERIVQLVMDGGTCQNLEELPDSIRHTFVVSSDITAEEHVRMQAALQAYVDNSLSKTVNFPEDAEEQDVALAYQLAWELGCKGITVYVTGSRQKVVLETHATAKKKEAPMSQPEPQASPAPLGVQEPLWHETKKPRPRGLRGVTFSISTPLGKTFVTINENGGRQPFEVFINTAKAGSDTAAVSEAIGRLISYLLRLASPISPRERLKEVWRQLSGIGGGRSLGFGPNRVRSLPDGVAQAIAEYLEGEGQDSQEEDQTGYFDGSSAGGNGGSAIYQPPLVWEAPEHAHKIGDLCPECGQASVVNEEGCRKCYACGFSEC